MFKGGSDLHNCGIFILLACDKQREELKTMSVIQKGMPLGDTWVTIKVDPGDRMHNWVVTINGSGVTSTIGFSTNGRDHIPRKRVGAITSALRSDFRMSLFNRWCVACTIRGIDRQARARYPL